MTFLPYGRQEITDADVEAVAEALRADFITQGPRIAEFEQAMCRYLGASHAVAVSSGTAALHTAAFAAGLRPGDEAITSPITMTIVSSNRFRILILSTANFVERELERPTAGPGDRGRG